MLECMYVKEGCGGNAEGFLHANIQGGRAYARGTGFDVPCCTGEIKAMRE